MGKRANTLVAIILFAGSLSAVMAQDAPTVSTPSISDNASPLDNNIKMRSVELERVKRDAEKTAVLRRDNGKELNFSLIKGDFEGIQQSHADLINAYTMGDTINYKTIAASANKITEMAVRLRGNVFEPKAEDEPGAAADMANEGTADSKSNPYLGKTVRDLIVELDNAIGEVVTNPMWQKLAVIDPEVSRVVEARLVKVIETSNALWIESTKKTSK
jgi:hypothetical protein